MKNSTQNWICMDELTHFKNGRESYVRVTLWKMEEITQNDQTCRSINLIVRNIQKALKRRKFWR